MSTIIKIALRNVFRYKRRTLLSALTIAFGLFIYILMDSVMTGMDRLAIDNLIKLSSAAIKVHTMQYQEEKKSLPLDFGIKDFDTIASHLKRDPNVKGVTPRTSFLAQLSNYERTIPVMGTIIAPGSDTSVFTLYHHIKGEYLTTPGLNSILIGKDLAREMGVGVGDGIILYALTRYNSRNADEFIVTGIIHTTDPAINKSSVIITYDAANQFLDLEGLITEVDVGMYRRTNFGRFIKEVDGAKGAIYTQFGRELYHVETFKEAAASFLEMMKQKKAFGVIFMIVILLIASVGIFNTVLMSVYERVREVGVLRAHGMKPGDVTFMFLMEGVITGLLGSVLGVLFGVLANIFLVTVGYPIDKMVGDIDTSGFPVWGTIYGEWNPQTFLFVFVFGVIVSAVASVIPARKAAKIEVTEALRFV